MPTALQRLLARRQCETYLRAMVRLIAADSYKTFRVRAFEGVQTAWQARRMQDLLNQHARHAPSGIPSWTSDVPEDQWYVVVQMVDGVDLLECRYDEINLSIAWTAMT